MDHTGRVLIRDFGPDMFDDDKEDDDTDPSASPANEGTDKDDEHARPEIDRLQLRDLLLSSIPASSVQWGKKFISLSPTTPSPLTDGTPLHTILFADGTSLTTPLLVGADGTWSRVRPLLSPVQPSYVGLMLLDGHIPAIDDRFPHLATFVSRGTSTILGPDCALIPQRNGGGNVRVYAILRTARDTFEDEKTWPFHSDPVGAAKKIESKYYRAEDGWVAEARELIHACATPSNTSAPTTITPRPIYELPPPHTWPPRAGITILGDAAHVASPSGEGANLAMLDGAELALAIIESSFNAAHTSDHDRPSLADATAEFEKTMQERCKERDDFALEKFILPGGAEESVEYVKRTMAAMLGR